MVVNNNIRYKFLALLAVAISAFFGASYAQDYVIESDELAPLPTQQRDVLQASQQFLLTENVAGLSLNNLPKGSFTTISYSGDQGSLHRAQEGEATSLIRFATERYDAFNKSLFMKTTFAIDVESEDERAWSDAMRTYNSNPFYYGSSRASDYSQQLYHLNLALYTAPIWGNLSFGFGIDYQVADFSNNKDPRPRTNMLQMSYAPSLIYTIAERHNIGASFKYGYRKEKLLGLTTVQTDPLLDYYTFTGLDSYVSSIGGYKAFERQFIENDFSIAAQYSYNGENSDIVVEAQRSTSKEMVYGSNMQSPGHYKTRNMSLLAQMIRYGDNSINTITFDAKGNSGRATEYIQEKVTSTNVNGTTSENYETIYEYTDRYTMTNNEVVLGWNLRSNAISYDVRGGLFRNTCDVTLSYSDFNNTHYLPESYIEASSARAALSYTRLLLARGRHTLDLKVGGWYSYALSSKGSFAQGEDDIVVQSIYLNDLELYTSDMFGVSAKMTYSFPIRYSSGKYSLGYIAFEGGYCRNKLSMSRTKYSVSLGLMTF